MRSCDVLVVGGGVIGVCTAYSLQQRGLRTALVERGVLNAKEYSRFAKAQAFLWTEA